VDLANALSRRFYSGSEPNVEHLDLLVSYVRRTMTVLDQIDLNLLMAIKTFKWLPLVETNEESVYYPPRSGPNAPKRLPVQQPVAPKIIPEKSS
jgi:hypothetical protein